MLGMGKRRLDMFFSPYPEQLFISPVLGLSSSTSVTSVAVHEWRWGFLACLVCGDLWGMVACCSWVTAESKEIPHKKIVLLSLLQNECVKYCCKLLGYVCLDSQLWLTTWIVQQQEQQRIQRRICSFAIKTALALSSDGRCEEHAAVYQCKHQYIHTFSAGIGVMSWTRLREKRRELAPLSTWWASQKMYRNLAYLMSATGWLDLFPKGVNYWLVILQLAFLLDCHALLFVTWH